MLFRSPDHERECTDRADTRPARVPGAATGQVKQRVLYILALKDEPIIKVGFTIDIYLRSLKPGSKPVRLRQREADQAKVTTNEYRRYSPCQRTRLILS